MTESASAIGDHELIWVSESEFLEGDADFRGDDAGFCDVDLIEHDDGVYGSGELFS
ncbi:MAG: hypothetical protein RI897_1438 [Verrucomicrobiota bacterium]